MSEPTYEALVRPASRAGKIFPRLCLMEPGTLQPLSDFTASQGQLGRTAIAIIAKKHGMQGHFVTRVHEGIVYVLRLKPEDIAVRS